MGSCAFAVNEEELLGRECYGGLDLSSSTDITAFRACVPAKDDTEKIYDTSVFLDTGR